MIQAALLLLSGLLSVVYLYFRYTYSHWTRKGIPQATPTFLFGNLLDVVLKKKNAGCVYNELYSKYTNNDAVGFYEFNTPKLLIRTPELFQRVLISDFSSFYDNEITVSLKHDPFLELDSFVMTGDKWKPARNALINGMTKGKLKDMYELMKQTLPHFYNYIDSSLGEDLEAQELSSLFMMTNVSNTVYGIDNNCFKDKNSMMQKMNQIFAKEYWQSWWQVIIIFHLQNIRDFLGFSFLPKKVSSFVKDMMRQVVDVRVKNNIKRNDFLQYYLNQNKSLEEKVIELTKHGMTFFIGGFEPSSLISASILYELALNLDVQENLYQELEETFKTKSEFDYDTIMNLPYLEKVFKEGMRKYPIMYAFMKLCTKTTSLQIDGKSIVIDKGTPVVIPVYAVQYDPQYFPDPEVFDPERFSEEAMQSRHPCTWIPFGAGPRICAGIKFGLLQAKLLVASAVHRYRIIKSDHTPLSLTWKKTAFIVSPAEDQWIKFEKRT